MPVGVPCIMAGLPQGFVPFVSEVNLDRQIIRKNINPRPITQPMLRVALQHFVDSGFVPRLVSVNHDRRRERRNPTSSRPA